jgi:hypothetical protein
VSDYNPFEGEVGPVEGSPAEGGVATGDGQPTDQSFEEEAPKQYLDTDSSADQYVRVRVDGEEVEVPLREALQGYSRTADYTRKTQELATQRQQAEYALTLQRALQAQPEETLRLLARQFNVPFDQQSPPPQAGAPSYYDDGYDEDEYADPTDRRFQEQQKVIDQLVYRDQRREADQALQRAIGGLQRKYNLDQTTINEVVQTALQSRVGPEAFEAIYKGIAFDRAHLARQQAQAQRAEADTRRRVAGQQANQLIGNGSSAASVGAPMAQPPSDGRMSISEAFDSALNELGMQI